MVLYTIRRTSQMKCYYDGNASTSHKQNAQCSGSTKKCFKTN